MIVFYLARCVFVPTNFSSFESKDSLAFFAKRGKNAELVFFVEIELDIIANKKRYFFR